MDATSRERSASAEPFSLRSTIGILTLTATVLGGLAAAIIVVHAARWGHPTWRVPSQAAPSVVTARPAVLAYLSRVHDPDNRTFCDVAFEAPPRMSPTGGIAFVGYVCTQYVRHDGWLWQQERLGDVGVVHLVRTEGTLRGVRFEPFFGEGMEPLSTLRLAPRGLRDALEHGQVVGEPRLSWTQIDLDAYRGFGCTEPHVPRAVPSIVSVDPSEGRRWAGPASLVPCTKPLAGA